MKDQALLEKLEEAAGKLSIKLSYEDLKKGEVDTRGGLCIVKGERRIIVHKHLDADEKADVLIDILSRLDTDSIHLAPQIRERLQSAARRAASHAAQEDAGATEG